MHRLHNVLHFLFASLKFREMVVDRVEPQHRVLAEMFQLSIQKVSTSNKSFLPKTKPCNPAFTEFFSNSPCIFMASASTLFSQLP